MKSGSLVERMRSALRRVVLITRLLIVGSTVHQTQVYAFSEDICVQVNADDTRQLVNCLDAKSCDPKYGNTDLCRANIVIDAARAVALAGRENLARSMIHVDATYFLAQAIGFTPEAAYWIAAYDEVVDTGAYQPFGVQGNLLKSQDGIPVFTAALNGWTRTSAETAGFLVHIDAPFGYIAADDPTYTAMYPRLDDPYREGMLYHQRAWALGERDACAAGFTVFESGNPYVGDACFQQDDRLADEPWLVQKHIFGSTPGSDDGNEGSSVPLAYSGDQIASFTPADPASSEYQDRFIDDVVYASDLSLLLSGAYTDEELEAVLGGRSHEGLEALTRIGIYLHMVQDRISHYECADHSTTGFEPKAVGGEGAFVVTYDSETCSTEQHAYNHYLEIGTGTGALPDRTISALQYTWSELKMFREEMPELQGWLSVTAPSKLPDRIPGDMLTALTSALRVKDASKRNQAMIQLMARYCFKQMPGNDGVVKTVCQ